MAGFLVYTLLGGLLVWLTVVIWQINAEVALDRGVEQLITSNSTARFLIDGETLGLGPEGSVRLGSRTIVILVAIALGLLAAVWRDRLGAIVAVVGPGLTGALTEYLLKPLINTPSPVGARAFPSGHAGGVAALAAVAVLLAYRRWGAWPALLLAPIAAIPILLVGGGLLRLDYHYPTDVIGGTLLGPVVVFGLAWCTSLAAAITRRQAWAEAGDPPRRSASARAQP